MLRKISFAMLALALLATNANAAAILQLVIDPLATAGTGVDPVNGFSVNSTQSGAGRYQLFAMDDTAGSLGISSYNIFVNNATSALHRSPVTSYQDDAENSLSGGFPLLRSANNLAPIGTFQGSQPLPGTATLISGMGQGASDFQTKLPDAVAGTFALTTSGQWGNYSNIDPDGALNWVLIGEGAYAGGAPSVGSAAVVTYFNDQFASLPADIVIPPPCMFECGGVVGGVLTIDPLLATLDPAFPAQLIEQQFNALLDGGATTADSWSITGFTKDGVAAVPTNAPSISSTGLFSWMPTLDDLGPVGADADWQALIQATKAGSDNASATFNIGLVIPEPTTMSLFGLAMVGAIGFLRRR